MSIWRIMTSNYIINVGFASWVSAQLLKTLFTLLLTKRLNLERMVGAGGMPSSHSALTSSIAMGMVRKVGFSSPIVGLSLAFAAVVMYDAMGVRRAAGEQAKVLNKLVFSLPDLPFLQLGKPSGQDEQDGPAEGEEEPTPLLIKELKEFLGHTPLEVLGGCLLGILIAIFIPVN